MRKSNQKSAVVPEGATILSPSTDRKAAKALENLSKYPHADQRQIWRAPDGRHLMVVIRCQHPGCSTERAIYTSDCWQVSTCAEHKKGAKAKAPKVERVARKRSAPKSAPKGGRKARGQRKATPGARRGRRTATPSTVAEVGAS